MSWRRSAEEQALDVKLEFKSKYQGRGMSITFRSDNTAWVQMNGSHSWSLLEEDELRRLMLVLIEQFPLDALGGV